MRKLRTLKFSRPWYVTDWKGKISSLTFRENIRSIFFFHGFQVRRVEDVETKVSLGQLDTQVFPFY